MLDAAPGAAGDRWRQERTALWDAAREALPYVIAKAVEMPMVHGLDVGPRIVYDRPPPYEHVIEYVEAAALGYSFDDPRGWYEAEADARPFQRIRDYQALVADFCRRWRLAEPWARRMIIHGHVRAVAADDLMAGERALDELAGSSEASDPAFEAEVAAILET
jgi:hypothetical protein